MNSKFKSYKSKFLLAGLVAFTPMGVSAKTAVENETDTVNADKEMVQVAYRKVAKNDLFKGCVNKVAEQAMGSGAENLEDFLAESWKFEDGKSVNDALVAAIVRRSQTYFYAQQSASEQLKSLRSVMA